MTEGTDSVGLYAQAIDDFRRARFRAKLEQLLAVWRGESAECLDYDEVRKTLGATSQVPRGLRNIPIDAIVGSVGRCSDFTRTFLPRQDNNEGRWAKIKLAVTGPVGLPPIEVYQIGQAYFVLDGNHRVSVAREVGAKQIQAYVTEVNTEVPFSPDVRPDELILKAEYAEFLNQTKLAQLRPQADLSVSVPGQYKELEEHISVHRYFMGIDQQREVSYPEAVTHWYDAVYLPVAEAIREQGILAEFPDRTEADLYLWVMEHRAELADELGIEIELRSAAADLAARFSPATHRVAERVSRRVLDAVVPEGLVAGPAPGQWRQARQRNRARDSMFADVLLAFDGHESGRHALAWALEMARREKAAVHGLYVVSTERAADGKAAQAVRIEFEQRCRQAGVPGELTTGVGKVPRLLCERARWMDLVVLSLSHPYASAPRARLESGLRTIMRRCPTPIVVVPRPAAGLDRLLLAFDGSPKAREALFVAAYLAGKWGVSLTVLTVTETGRVAKEALDFARDYLSDHRVQATFMHERGPVAPTILVTAEEQAADLILVGGYGFGPVAELALGSTVEELLQSSAWPVLVCH